MRYAMIMAGGAGTRLWPMSRKETPKQLVPLVERPGRERRLSMLEVAAERLEGLIPPERRLICTNESYRAQIQSVMPSFSDPQILGEPVGRDTVNAVGFAAAVLQKQDPDAVFAVLTADQLIEPEDRFRAILDLGYTLVEAEPDRLVTFSITPTYPATGFGYVQRGEPIDRAELEGKAFEVKAFVEKPDAARAQQYLDAGTFGWNAGMFVWKASTVLSCIERYAPESYAGVMEIASAWGGPEQWSTIERVYPQLPKISVDYAIMEPAARERADNGDAAPVRLATVEMDLKWLDVGSWPSFAETLEPDAEGNRRSGRATLMNTRDTLVVNDDPQHTVALLGVEGLTVVHTPRATLVMRTDDAQDLKALHEGLGEGEK
jgi:mannose-1-phosphate guanylyltransferase